MIAVATISSVGKRDIRFGVVTYPLATTLRARQLLRVAAQTASLNLPRSLLFGLLSRRHIQTTD